jgi:hypothetical protein
MRSFLLLCSVFFAKTITANLITIRNDIPRLDNTGTIMDAHDCTIRVLPNGTYVMHAIEYGLCLAPTGQGCDQTPDHCGFRSNHNITVWTSNDLTSGSWNYVGYAFPLESRPVSLIFRPDAIFNPHTNLWILYYNDAGRGNTYISSTSSSPFGPFTGFTTSNITDSTYSGGDFHLFIDENDNNQGYIIWTAMSSLPGQDHKIRISKLTNDFLGKTNDAPYVFNDNAPTTTFNEAPSIFKRGDTWYALFGHCCCFCEQGSGLFVHTAPTPLGPWTAAGATSPYDISCEAPPPPPPSNPFCAYKPEFNLVTVNLTCLNGGVINSVSKAFFGTPTGSCPDYSAGACDDPTFLPYAQATCVGQTTCVLESQGADPCLGTVKSIAVVATCSVAPGGYSPDGPVQPSSEEAVQISVGGSPTPGQGCLYGGSTDISVTRSQQDFLATLPDGLGGFSYVYYGGRWGQSPDGIKGHEPQYVYPLQFNDDGSIQHITWNDTVSFNLAVAK